MKLYSKYLFNRFFAVYILTMLLSFIILLTLTFLVILEDRSWWLLIAAYVFYISLTVLFYALVYKPYMVTNKVLKLFAEGHMVQGVFELKTPFSREMERSNNKFKEILDTKKLISLSKKQAEYLALQNQINPHFLYNTLEGIRSEALIAGMDSVAEMTEALATFFRYTISNVESLVSLEDELKNIENYYIIQQFRFGDRISLDIIIQEDDEEKEEEIIKYMLPKLTLQPIVENSIYHGIERKIGKGNIRLNVQTSNNYLIITISDDGMGMEKERYKELEDKLRSMNLNGITSKANKEGGIALVNVNNRIKLLFGEEYGIHIYSTYSLGTDVEILLPLIKG